MLRVILKVEQDMIQAILTGVEGVRSRDQFDQPRKPQRSLHGNRCRVANPLGVFFHRDSFRGRFAPTTMADLFVVGNFGGQGSAARAPKGAVA
ncbi:MAG: hypothetical protein ACLGIM_02845 [Alphaproteobacteria bacterium]